MRTFILFVFCCLFLFSSNSQQVYFELDEALPGDESHLYIASDYIKLLPDFYYKPDDGTTNSFRGKIDEDAVYPVIYQEEPISVENRQLDYNFPVGTTAGSHSVSLTGAATYQIPIVIPPGTAGMVPQISLAYNSQAGNGLLGYGWNIAGLSAITRAGHTIYHDGTVKGVDFNDDRFALDGNRLIVITGDYGADQSVYYTENFNASKITSYGSVNGGGPANFTVETKDGKIIEYGNTDDSRVETISSMTSYVISWLINKITDKNGNYIEFVYHKESDHTQYWIEEIKYTGNDEANLDPYNSIRFYYAEREDKNTVYIAGSKIKQNVLLRKIKTFHGNDLLRKYELKYHLDFYSHLVEVKEYNGDGERYNSTVFEWEQETGNIYFTDILEYVKNPEKNNNTDNQSKTQKEGTYYKYYFADYNGDGNDDMLELKYSYDQGEIITEKWTIYRNETTSNLFGGGYHIDEVFFTTSAVAACKQVAFGDINGDGLADVLQLDYVNNTYKLYYYFSKPNCTTLVKEYNGDYIITGKVAKMDLIEINGDGLADILMYENEYGQDEFLPKVLISSEFSPFGPYGVEYTSLSSFSSIVSETEDEILFLDFDGDGTNEIMVLDILGTGYKIYKYENDEMVLFKENSVPNAVNYWVTTGDFNGDTKSDLLYFNQVSNEWKIGYSKGTNFIEKDAPISNTYDPDESHYSYIIGDYNGDGMHDIWESYIEGGYLSMNYINIYYSYGDGFVIEENITHNDELANFEFQYKKADLNGDGKTDLISHFKTQEISLDHLWAILIHPIKNRNLIKSISNGFNNVSKFYYAPLTHKSYYSKLNYSFELNLGDILDMQHALFVVYQVKADNGIGSNTYTTFNYAGARIHKFGKGFLGFKEIISNNLTTGIRTVNNFNNLNSLVYNNGVVDFLYLHYVLDETEVFDEDDNLLSSVENTNSVINTYSNQLIYLPYLYDVTKKDELNNIKTKVDNIVIDEYGNTESSTINYYGGDGISIEGTKTTVTTFTDEDSWCNYLPDYVTITQIREGEPAFSKNIDFVYYNNGLLKDVISFDGLPKAVTKHFTYNDFGNVESTTISASNLTPRTINYTFDSKGRFITQKTNDLNHSLEFVNDHKTGQVLESTDINGLKSYYKYDSFGRLEKLTYPNGNKSYYASIWDADNSYGNILFYTQNLTDGSPETRTYFDLFARERINSIENLDGTFSSVETLYNGIGKVDKVSEPFFYGNTPSQWTYYDYKNDGRINEIEHPNSETTNYSYAGRTTSVLYSGTGISNSRKIDAFGLAVEATDPGGTIEYNYYSSGLPKNIITPDNSIFEMFYDDYGRQNKLFDPDAGQIEYEYNAYGELVWQKDAELNEFNMYYDILGRPDYKTASDGSIINYYYVTQGNGLEQIFSIVHSNGISYSYDYDNLSRLSKETEVIDGTSYETAFIYDDNGNTETITYPTGFSVLYNYKDVDNGYLSEVRRGDNNEILYNSPAYNVRRQLTGYDLGNGYHTDRGFDDYGFPTSIVTGGGNIQNLSFDFNPATGNLNWREDNSNGLSLHENFSYDTYAFNNRLTEWGEDNQDNFNIIYASNGNIKSKTDVTAYSPNSYQYNSPKPHAVTDLNTITQEFLEFTENNDQDIQYNIFNKISSIVQGDKKLEFTYGPDEARKIMKYYEKDSEDWLLRKTKYYIFGNYEIEQNNTTGKTRDLIYIVGFAIKEDKSTGEDNLYYVYSDYLGNLQTVIDENGNIIKRYSFDPWGRRRNPDTWQNLTFNELLAEDFIFDRGFTGHEHLDLFGLINMNGRMYDPLLGRMLSPDNYVQAPFGSQGYNRYSYAANNPLIFTDPDGEVAVAGIIILAGIELLGAGLILQDYATYYAHDPNLYAIGTGMVIVGSTAIGYGLSAAAPAIASSGFVGGFVYYGVTASAVTFSTSLMSGNDVNDALKHAGIAGLSAGVLGGLSGYFESQIQKIEQESALTYEFTVDVRTGEIRQIGDMGGKDVHFYYTGYWTDQATAFAYINTFVIEGQNTINTFRFWESSLSTISAFSIPATGLSGYFLEPAGPATTKQNQDRRVPTGSYNLTPNTNSYPGDYMIYNNDVPASRGITMHIGNHPDNTTARLLPGSSWGNAPGKYAKWGNNWVSASGFKLLQLNSTINKAGYQNVRVNIFNVIR